MKKKSKAARANQVVHWGAQQKVHPAGAGRFAGDDLRDVPAAGVGQDILGRPAAALDDDRFAAQLLRQPQVGFHARPIRLGIADMARRLHVESRPPGAQGAGQPPGAADEPLGKRFGADADQQPVTGGPGLPDAFRGHVASHLGIHALGGVPQGQLAQRQEVAFAEEAVLGMPRLIRQVDLPLLEAHQQVIRWKIHQLHLVRPLQERVRHILAHHHAGDLGHHVPQALQVLDVEGGVDINARVQQLHHVLPALLVAGAFHIGVGQLIHEDEGRPAAEGGLQVEFREKQPAVRELLPRQRLQALQQGGGFLPAVGLHHADHHIQALGAPLLGFREHGVGLPHAGSRSEEDLQFGAPGPGFLLLHLPEAVTRSTGTGPVAEGSAARRAAILAATAAARAGLLGARLEAPLAAALYGPGDVAEGRPQKSPGSVKAWPIKAEPITFPSLRRRLPPA
jgi:hypothetical protein